MRSSELAALAGVTIRTVRHYLQIGLLEEPERSVNGYRDYDVRHLVRLLRITRLTELGLPLAALPDVLDEPQATEALLDELDRQLAAEIERLTERREGIARLRRHGAMPDLPPGMAAYGPTLSAVADIAPDMARHEREQIVLMSHMIGETGTSALADAMAQHSLFTPATTELLRRFGELGPDTPQEAIEQLADDMVTQYQPLLENWPDIEFGADVSSMLAAYGERNLNDQQHRANQLFADRVINRMTSRDVPAHDLACPAEPA
ncbi:MerR family transcriptional regulator [Nonomuraea sp. NEAU-A123]|uniref:MerR family transcriptional regulator n=1 Tax=Nonomuraea sp. NEAU-A123 TaxID=2839649 RepID=UPI001BE46C5F|nr:MerR family transcriptional regulator [Nonomuraea sp. NEAU-A123]MBT2229390.1 MerR family transcriptional regulator [Nonomuraea sp. NEAU-A123]